MSELARGRGNDAEIAMSDGAGGVLRGAIDEICLVAEHRVDLASSD